MNIIVEFSEESILLTVGRPASYDAGIRGKPLGGFPLEPPISDPNLKGFGGATVWLP